MDWNELEENIRQTCIINRKTEEYTDSFVEYAKNLYTNGLPIISSPEHFSQLVGMDYQYVLNMAYGTKKFYRHFTILKKNGKERQIDEPLPDLHFVQDWILRNLLEKRPVSIYTKSFIKKRSIKDNARFHRNQTVLVSMDIKDFFPSISIKDITSIFVDMGYYKNVSCFLAHLCCLRNTLPQGAPTSPYLSNLRMLQLDSKIAQYTRKRGIRYSRYADDLTFSGTFNPHRLINDISKMVFKEGFTINSNKTRVARKNCRQEVTGIIVNSKKMQAPKEVRKKIRQEVYYIDKFGIESHLQHINENRAHYLEHLLGKINFVLFINPNDKVMRGYFETIKQLLFDTLG